VFPVATGTATNALLLAACCKPWNAILCHPGSHIYVYEANAVEAASGGAKLLPVEGAFAVLVLHCMCREWTEAASDMMCWCCTACAVSGLRQ
jgi:threonine aldolase